jgi:hypothetical protein
LSSGPHVCFGAADLVEDAVADEVKCEDVLVAEDFPEDDREDVCDEVCNEVVESAARICNTGVVTTIVVSRVGAPIASGM